MKSGRRCRMNADSLYDDRLCPVSEYRPRCAAGTGPETWRLSGRGRSNFENAYFLYTPEPSLTESASGIGPRTWICCVVSEEDFPLGERMQVGFHSAAQETSPLAGTSWRSEFPQNARHALVAKLAPPGARYFFSEMLLIDHGSVGEV